MDPKQLLLAHFEKVALGAFALWLAATGVFFAMEPKELQQNKQLGGKMDTIRRHFKGSTVEDVKRPDWSSRLQANLAPDRVTSATPIPGWVMDQRPVFLFGVEAVAEGHVARHEPPVDLTLDASDRGRIGLKWQASVENEYVIIANYIIERRTGEDGEWEQIEKIEGVEESYGDTKVQARTPYFYRVTSVAEIDRDNPVVDSENMTLAKKEERKVGLEKGPISIAQDVFFLPTNGDPVTEKEMIAGQNEDSEWAYIRVYKWLDGKFQDKSFRVNRGKPIGEVVSRGRQKIDFTTGAVLEDVFFKKVKGKHGNTTEVLAITFRFADGTKAEATDKDELPAEVTGK